MPKRKAAHDARIATDADPKPPINILALGRGKSVSMSAKAALLHDLQELQYLPEDQAVSARRIAALRKSVGQRNTEYGRLIVMRTFETIHGPVEYPLQNPLGMLCVAMSESPRFAAYVRKARREWGEPTIDEPWTIALYIDDITCGNPLGVRDDARRKISGVFWSIYQLGAEALSDETCWFELAAFRRSISGAFIGSVSHMLNVCLSTFFDPTGVDARWGLVFTVRSDRDLQLFLAIEMLIADTVALVEVIGAMGMHGHLPCFLCRRILGARALSNTAIRLAAPHFPDMASLDQTKWMKHTNESLLNLFRELRDCKDVLDPTAFAKKQTANGYKHVANNFMLHPMVSGQPLKVIQLDWMHLFFQAGNWNREWYHVLATACHRNFCAYSLYCTYTSAFTFPTAERGVLKLLRPEHWESCKDAEPPLFKSAASEGLSLYAVSCKFADDVLLKRFPTNAPLHAKAASYRELCNVIDLVVVSKHGYDVDPDLLDAKIGAWRVAHANAYGKSLTYLKTHLTSHLPDNLRARTVSSTAVASGRVSRRFLFACWTLDRSALCIRCGYTPV